MINVHSEILKGVDQDEMWLLLHITKRINENSVAWPSNKTLALECGWSQDKLQRIKKCLTKKKLIDVLPQLTSKGQSSNRYFVKSTLIGNYTPSAKSVWGEGGKSYSPEVVKSGMPPLVESGNEVLISEELINEVLNIREIHSHELFLKIKKLIFANNCNSDTEKKIQDQVARIFEYYEKNIQSFQSNFNYQNGGKLPFEMACQQIEAYHDYHYLNKSQMVYSVGKVAEFITSNNWCKKLEDLMLTKNYEPLEDDKIVSEWTVRLMYDDGIYYEHKTTGKIVHR